MASVFRLSVPMRPAGATLTSDRKSNEVTEAEEMVSFCHACLDTEANTLYAYGEEAKNRPVYLKAFKPDVEE